MPGCGTGEEALSIAMLVDEAMERSGKHLNVQIFATDIDAEAIDKARMGEYPGSIAADITPERLRRYFVKKNGIYKIKQEIREMVVYAVQNVISDPPFSRLDLISCRNVLIYLDADLQRQILPMFHFTLNPNGYLFLGTSETIGGAADLFSTVDLKWKIFQRKGAVQPRLANYPAIGLPATDVRVHRREQPDQGMNVRTLVERLVLEEYAPAAILINSRFEVLYLQGDTSRYLGMARGEPSYNLFNLAHEELRPKLLTVLRRAVGEKKTVKVESLRFRQPNGDIGYFNLTVRPLGTPGEANLYLMVFEEAATPQPVAKRGKGKAVAPENESRMS